MKSKAYIPRHIDSLIDDYLEAFRAVCIEGPKWCGKTMSAVKHSKSSIFLGDPENNFQNRRLAQTAPSLVLEGEVPRLIDEWQEVPPLWDAVRFQVDQRDKSGQFILTGSATPKQKGVLHSGAGRIARLKMDTMTLYELGESKGEVSLKKLCKGSLKPVMGEGTSLNRLATIIARGGWPASIGKSDKTALKLPVQYLKAIIEDDIHRLDDVERDPEKVRLLLKSLARNESTTASNNVLNRDMSGIEGETLDNRTIAAYLDAFRRLFLTSDTPPFSPNIRSSVRVKQSPKRHFIDYSLACALMKLTPESMIGDLNTFGFLFEALCEHDLKIYASTFDAKLYHYQDYKDREIDAIIELKNGDWCAFEIKLGANQVDAAAENLKKVTAAMVEERVKPPKVLAVLCGLGNAAYRRDDGVFVVPITMLRE